MKLVSMEKTEKEKKKDNDCCVPDSDEAYPWGLSIDLETESMAKLGISSPQVGSKVLIVSEAYVTSVSSREEKDGTPQQSVGYQITAMDINPLTKSTLADLYPTMHKKE